MLRILNRRQGRKKGNIVLQHDNARPRTSHATTDAPERLKLATIWHPSYRPDLTPYLFYLFPKIRKISGDNIVHLMKKLNELLEAGCGNSVNFFRDGFAKLVHRGHKFVELPGDCVKR